MSLLDIQLRRSIVFDDGVPPCATADPDAFFPERSGTSQTSVRTAKLICSGCQYRNPCLEWALEYRETGIWGGTTERERRKLRRASLASQRKSI